MITKNNSITKFIAAGIFVFALSFSAFAQSTDNDVIKSKAEVLTAIDVVALSDLNFGFVSPGIDKTVDYANTATPGNSNQTNVTTGRFRVDAGAGAAVNLEYTTLPALITHTNGTNKLKVPVYVSVYNSTATPVGATTLSIASGGTNIASWPAGGSVYIFLGGTCNPDPDQLAGVYADDVTLTATYN